MIIGLDLLFNYYRGYILNHIFQILRLLTKIVRFSVQ